MISGKKAQLVISVRSSLHEASLSHPELLAGIDKGSLRQTTPWAKNTSASRCFFPSWCHDAMGLLLRAASQQRPQLRHEPGDGQSAKQKVAQGARSACPKDVCPWDRYWRLASGQAWNQAKRSHFSSESESRFAVQCMAY